jgi:hypothetical protein
VRLSYLEVYQGRCFDLLRGAAPLAGAAAWDPFARASRGLLAPVAASADHALALLLEARLAPARCAITSSAVA